MRVLAISIGLYMGMHLEEIYPQETRESSNKVFHGITVTALLAIFIQLLSTYSHHCALSSAMVNLTIFVGWPLALQPIFYDRCGLDHSTGGIGRLKLLLPSALVIILQAIYWPTLRKACVQDFRFWNILISLVSEGWFWLRALLALPKYVLELCVACLSFLVPSQNT